MVYLSKKFIENCRQAGRGRIIPAFVLLLILASSCCDSDNELNLTSVNTTFEIETDFPSYDSANYDTNHLRILVEAVSLDEETKNRKVSVSEYKQGETVSLSMALPEDKYRIRVWCDFVPTNNLSDYQFNTELLHTGIISYTNHEDGNISKTAYSDYLYLDLEKTGSSTIRIFPKAATGRFSLMPLDIIHHFGDSIEIEVSYAGYFPLSYNTDKYLSTADGLTSGIGFKYREKIEQNKFIGIGDIFVCDTETIIFADIQTKDLAGNLISNTKIRIPIYRGMNTIIQGNFFTAGSSNGGIGINDKFDDEIIIEVNN